jgi:dihydrofolate reductase
MLERMRAAGISGDVHLVGGPATMHAFRAIGALDELRLHVAPLLLGSGTPLSPPGTEPLTLELTASRAFPDGVVELTYGLRRSILRRLDQPRRTG